MKQIRNSVVKWLLVSLLCLLLGFLLGKFKQDILNEQLAVITLELQSMNTRNEGLETDIAGFQAVSIAEQQAIASLVQKNKDLQDELSSVNNKLFFYERVISPELEKKGVEVHSFEITRNESEQQWEYELVLMQSQKGRRFLNGKFSINFSAFEGEELKLIALTELNEDQKGSFKFKYFQTIKGAFSLPEEITVDEVILQLSVPGNRWHKAQSVEQRYDWRVLTTENISDLDEFDSNISVEQ